MFRCASSPRDTIFWGPKEVSKREGTNITKNETFNENTSPTHLKVGVVNVRVDAKQLLENLLHDRLKVLGKRHIGARGEDLLIVQQRLDPVHQRLHVLGRAAPECKQTWKRAKQSNQPEGDGRLHLDAVGPVILKLGAGAHDGAGLLGAPVRDGAVQQVDLIVKVHRVHGQPLILLLRVGQLHCRLQVAAAQRRLGVLVQVVPLGALTVALLGAERLVLSPVVRPAARAPNQAKEERKKKRAKPSRPLLLPTRRWCARFAGSSKHGANNQQRESKAFFPVASHVADTIPC